MLHVCVGIKSYAQQEVCDKQLELTRAMSTDGSWAPSLLIVI